MVDVGSTEPFLEAYSSVMIMSIISSHAYFSVYNLDGSVNEFTNSTKNNFEVVFNSEDKIGSGFIFWTFSWATSFFTASLGITKFLLNGPCPILSDKGSLGGICTWNFVLCFIVVFISIITKLIFLRCVLDVLVTNDHILLASLVFLLHFIPNLTVSFISIFMVTGYNKQFMKILVDFPGLWLMPVVSHLTFGPTRINCVSSNSIVFDKRKLGFSKLLTVINMIITFSSYSITTIIVSFVYANEDFNLSLYDAKISNISVLVPTMIISIICTVIFLVLDTSYCCNFSRSCQPQCCCGPSCFEFIYQYINVTDKIEIWQCDENEIQEMK